MRKIKLKEQDLAYVKRKILFNAGPLERDLTILLMKEFLKNDMKRLGF